MDIEKQIKEFAENYIKESIEQKISEEISSQLRLDFQKYHYGNFLPIIKQALSELIDQSSVIESIIRKEINEIIKKELESKIKISFLNCEIIK